MADVEGLEARLELAAVESRRYEELRKRQATEILRQQCRACNAQPVHAVAVSTMLQIQTPGLRTCVCGRLLLTVNREQ